MNLTSPSKDYFPTFNPRLRLGVLASGNGSNFENIVSSPLDADIQLLIVNNSAANVIERAKRLNIEYMVLNHMDFANRNEFEEEIIKYFTEANVEGLIMAGWNRIVTPRLIQSFPNRIVNIHPSILPSFKGMNAIQQALSSHVKITGCTVHVVSEELDSGPILVQSAVPILDSDNYEILLDRIHKQEHQIFPYGIALAAQQWRSQFLGIEAR